MSNIDKLAMMDNFTCLLSKCEITQVWHRLLIVSVTVLV